MTTPYGRRKEKPPEYEDDPIIAMPDVESDRPTERIDPNATKPKIIREGEVDESQLKRVSTDTVKHEGFDEITNRVANKFKSPKIVTVKNVEQSASETVESTVTKGRVINPEPIITEPSDETVEGWGKVIGQKGTKVIRVKDESA
jgi:hypothetical protein